MSDEKPQEVVVNVRIDQTDLDEVMKKIERIHDLAKEANLLAGELASEETVLNFRFKFEG